MAAKAGRVSPWWTLVSSVCAALIWVHVVSQEKRALTVSSSLFDIFYSLGYMGVMIAASDGLGTRQIVGVGMAFVAVVLMSG